MAITQEKDIQMLEKLPDGSFKIKYPETKIEQVRGLSEELANKEPAFEKNTAFNKDFGTTENTVCEGDDPRLADDRNPKSHEHNPSEVGLGKVDNAKQMPIAGGTFTGVAKAQANTTYTTAQLRNVIQSTADPSGGSNGDIWIKYK